MSILQLAADLAVPEHPGRLVGAMVVQVAIVGGLIWLIVWAVRNARAPKPPQNPYPPAYYQQFPPPQAPWPPQPPYPAPPGGAWPPQPPSPPRTRHPVGPSRPRHGAVRRPGSGRSRHGG